MMDIKEFWEEYINKDILEISDKVIEYFNGEIPEEVYEEYELEEVVLELKNALEDVKRYEEVIAFEALLKLKHPTLYEDLEIHFMESLTEYYCYMKDKEKLSSYLERYIEDPLKDIDYLLKSSRFLIFHNHSDLIEELARKSYRTINDSSEVLGGAFELARPLLFIELQKKYEHYLNSNELTLETLNQELSEFDFNFTGDYFTHIAEAFQFDFDSKEAITQLKIDFKKNRDRFLDKLGILFHIYMYQRKVSFMISGEIWNLILGYWMEDNAKQKRDSNRFFAVKHKTFDRFLAGLSGMFMDYSVNIFAALWGSCYIYDFLLLTELIDKKTHQSFKSYYTDSKHTLMVNMKPLIWKYDYVMDWSKPESVSEEDWEKEQKVFENNFTQKTEREPFIPSKEYDFTSLIDEDEKQGIEVEETMSIQPKNRLESPPIPKEPKVVLPRKFGRNEKVTVRYKDGTMKENVKFKVVQKDLEKGDCELV